MVAGRGRSPPPPVVRPDGRISADIEALGSELGHRTLTVLRKGGKMVTIPLAPRTARAIDLAVGERTDGPIFLRPDGQRIDRHGAGRIVHRIACKAGLANKRISLHTYGTRSCSSPPPSMPASRYATSKKHLVCDTPVASACGDGQRGTPSWSCASFK